jgi:hypothetical protein
MRKEATMVRWGIAMLSLLVVGTLSAAPEISEQQQHELAAKLAGDGLSGRLAEALKSDWGRKALNERIELVMAGPLARIRRSSHALWEEHYFSSDPIGRLVLRPERKAEFERVLARKPLALARFDKFCKRLDELSSRIAEDSDLDKGAKAGWSERDWRIGMFNGYVAGGLGDSDLDAEQVFDCRVLLWLMADAAGKLKISEPGVAPITQLIHEVYGLTDEIKKYEPGYLKLVAKADPQTAKAASADEVVAIACLKLAAEVKETRVDAVTKLLELDPKEALKDAEAMIREVARLKPRIDAVAAALAADDTKSNDLRTLLNDARMRVLLVHKLTPTDAALDARFDWYFKNIIPNGWCDAKDDKLVFKRNLFRSHTGENTVQGFRAHTYDSWSFQLRGMQQLFRSTAERCADAAIADTLRDFEVLALLRQDEMRISETRAAAVQDRSLETFVKIHFDEKDGKYVVRSEREKSIESLLSRAEELRPKN